VKVCPEVFGLDRDGKADLKTDTTDLESAKIAYEDCPAGAIRIR
jgi:ferredoxin